MKNSIIEVIKANKKAILKKALIVGGTIAGLAIVMNVARSKEGVLDIANEVAATANDGLDKVL
jgi:hypothetical protein